MEVGFPPFQNLVEMKKIIFLDKVEVTDEHGEGPDIDDPPAHSSINIPEPERENWGVEDLISESCPELEEPVPKPN